MLFALSNNNNKLQMDETVIIPILVQFILALEYYLPALSIVLLQYYYLREKRNTCRCLFLLEIPNKMETKLILTNLLRTYIFCSFFLCIDPIHLKQK